MTRNTLAGRDNEAYGQGNGRQSFRTVLRYHSKTLDTGVLLLAVFTLELEMDYRALPTDNPSPIFSEGGGEGGAVHRLSGTDIPAS